MSAIQLDIKELNSYRETYDLLKKNKLKKGDRIRIVSEDEELQGMWAVLLIVFCAIALYFKNEREHKGNRFGKEVLDDLFGNKTQEELEEEIEKEYGISIEVKHQKESGEVREPSPSYWLGKIADEGTLSEKIKDPAEWQRKEREDRDRS